MAGKPELPPIEKGKAVDGIVGEEWGKDQEFRFGCYAGDAYQTLNWVSQVGNWMYESGKI